MWHLGALSTKYENKDEKIRDLLDVFLS